MFCLDDSIVRMTVFLCVLAVMALLELRKPARRLLQAKSARWLTNFSIATINVFVLFILGPVSAVVAADFAMSKGIGLINFFPVSLPLYIEVIIGVILLDLAIYFQHVLSHKIPLLWRLHRVHHADQDIDVSTGLRFHPLEAMLSMLYKCVVILALGPVTIAVIIFELLLNASSMFNHSNIRLPHLFDKLLRAIIVTPDIHRVHHSVIRQETDSNYGFCISWWDRLFGTYTAQPARGHEQMEIGLSQYQQSNTEGFLWTLKNPFSSSKRR